MRSVKLLFLLVASSFSLNTSAQWQTISNNTGTTQNYGGVNVTVTSSGGVTGGGCIGHYWIPQSNGYYDYAFSTPVAAVQIELDAVNIGESVEFLINGQMFPIQNCNMDTAQFISNCSVGNCNIVNGQLVNNTSFWTCGGKLTFYGPIGSFTVREPIGGSGATYNISFVPLGTNVGGCFLQSSILGDFTFTASKTCAGAEILVATANYVPNMSIHTYFGDGNVDVTAVTQGTGGGYAYIDHDYAASGNYTLKQVLYVGNVAQDSLQLLYEHHFCTHVPLHFYNDVDNDCSYTNNDVQPYLPFRIQIDSNSVTIDTIPVSSALYYIATGNPGDVYDFKIIDLPGDIVPTCPSTGVTSVTLQNLVYYTSPYEMGLNCAGSNNFDLGITASFITAANTGRAYIYPSNLFCMPQNAVVTYSFSPKYSYSSASPAPSSVVGNTVTWNLSNLSVYMSQPPSLYVNLTYNGMYLTPGDTVHSTVSISPTTGDVNQLNNMIVSEDTVTGPFDPNGIYVSPSSCVLPGTELTYTVTFENLGNVPAEQIYVMDTLSPGFDLQSLKIVGSSHAMTFTKLNSGGYDILKFEFPNINLPGANDPARHGAVTYKLRMNGNYPIGSSVTNKAGIYFDYMPAVLTNVASTEACWPTSVNTSTLSDKVSIYPNPATDKLQIRTGGQFSAYTISNSIGQVMMRSTLSYKDAGVDIAKLPAGVYSIKLEGDAGNAVKTFVKM